MKKIMGALFVATAFGCSEGVQVVEAPIIDMGGAVVDEIVSQGKPKGLAEKAGERIVVQMVVSITDAIEIKGCDENTLKKIGSAMDSKDLIEMGLRYETLLVEVSQKICTDNAYDKGKANEWQQNVIALYRERYPLAAL